MIKSSSTLNAELREPYPDRSPYGDIGRTGSPSAYLIDPGAGSASDRVTRFWPSREALDDIYSRGGSIAPLYTLDRIEALERERTTLRRFYKAVDEMTCTWAGTDRASSFTPHSRDDADDDEDELAVWDEFVAARDEVRALNAGEAK